MSDTATAGKTIHEAEAAAIDFLHETVSGHQATREMKLEAAKVILAHMTNNVTAASVPMK